MNLGLVTSYIIAGMILLAILMMNMSVSSSSNEITMTQIAREKVSTISDMLSNDIQKMGYNQKGKTSSILTDGKRKKIQFQSNIDNSSDGSVEIITWELTTNEVTNTTNPDDYVLMRTVNDLTSGSLVSQTPIKSGVTKFTVGYYDTYGKNLADSLSTPLTASELSDVKQLYITVKLQSGEKVFKSPSTPGYYVTSVWEKRFSPPNLEF